VTARVETTKSPRRLPIADVPVADARAHPLAPPRDRGAGASSVERALRVGELAKRTGKTVRALHLYEEIGVLEPARRTDAGYRLYAPDAITRVEWITRLQDTGLSLPEIRDLLASWGSSGSAPGAMKKVTELYARKLGETRAQIARLRELEAELERSLGYLETCDTCEPQRAVAACPSCDRHECDTHTPVLVAGFHPPAEPSR
jgi:MerR family copper efflux transcriptional regulator